MSACVALRGSGYFFALSLLLAGCASGRSAEQAPRAGLAFEHPLRQSGSPSISLSARITVVESLTGPEDFEFVTVVLKTRNEPGGWQSACVPFRLMRDTGELYVCKLSVEVPIENEDGPISRALARRVAADCANLAAQAIFSQATPATPLFLACEEFKLAYENVLRAAVAGARIRKVCYEEAERAMERRGGL